MVNSTINGVEHLNGQFSSLHNEYEYPVMLDGELYPSVENAYQASKISDGRERFRKMTPHKARKNGGKLNSSVSSWDEMKYDILLDLLEQKFSDELCLKQLLKTGDREIIFKNHYDNDLGVVNGSGENTLGKALMATRERHEDTINDGLLSLGFPTKDINAWSLIEKYDKWTLAKKLRDKILQVKAIKNEIESPV